MAVVFLTAFLLESFASCISWFDYNKPLPEELCLVMECTQLVTVHDPQVYYETGIHPFKCGPSDLGT